MTETRRKGIAWQTVSPPKGEREEITFFFSQKKDFRAFLITLLSLVLPAFILFRGYFGATDARLERGVVVSLVLCYVFLRHRLGGKPLQERLVWLSWVDWFLVFLSAAIGSYVVWSTIIIGLYNAFFSIKIFGQEVPVDVIMGTLLLVLVLEANRRVMGWTLVIFVGVFLVYIPFRPYIPGPLGGAPLSWNQFVLQMFSEEGGIYGTGTSVLIDMVFLFLMFGAIMLESRAGDFFTSLANGFVGHQTGGSAKVSVAASAMFASVSGSAIGNVSTTGPITIPVMKAAGFKPSDAAAIEAVASTGGGITPPIMGAGAFLMAEFLGIPYGKIIVFAAMPAFAFYVAVFSSVHWKAKKEGLIGMSKVDIPSVKRVLLEGGYLVLPLITMVILLILGYSISRVGFVAVVSMVLLSFIKKETRMSPLRLVSAMSHTTRSTVIVSTALILIGVVISVVETSGVGLSISMMAYEFSGGSLLKGLLLAAVIAFVLGLPLPAMITYLYGVVFVIPMLIKLGANPLAAHMFFYYYGILGNLTPPVCITAFTAAAIAQAPMMKTGWKATKIGFMAYLLPFLFVFNPALLLQGGTLSDIPPLLLAFLGIIVCTTGLEGYFLKECKHLERVFLIAIGLCMILGLIWPLAAYTSIGILILYVVAHSAVQKKLGTA